MRRFKTVLAAMLALVSFASVYREMLNRKYYRDRTRCFECLGDAFYDVEYGMCNHSGDLAFVLSPKNPDRPNIRCPVSGKLYLINPTAELWQKSRRDASSDIAIVCQVNHAPIATRPKFFAKAFNSPDGVILELDHLPAWCSQLKTGSPGNSGQ